jgi:hypothetical protein
MPVCFHVEGPWYMKFVGKRGQESLEQTLIQNNSFIVYKYIIRRSFPWAIRIWCWNFDVIGLIQKKTKYSIKTFCCLKTKYLTPYSVFRLLEAYFTSKLKHSWYKNDQENSSTNPASYMPFRDTSVFCVKIPWKYLIGTQKVSYTVTNSSSR